MAVGEEGSGEQERGDKKTGLVRVKQEDGAAVKDDGTSADTRTLAKKRKRKAPALREPVNQV